MNLFPKLTNLAQAIDPRRIGTFTYQPDSKETQEKTMLAAEAKRARKQAKRLQHGL